MNTDEHRYQFNEMVLVSLSSSLSICDFIAAQKAGRAFARPAARFPNRSTYFVGAGAVLRISGTTATAGPKDGPRPTSVSAGLPLPEVGILKPDFSATIRSTSVLTSPRPDASDLLPDLNTRLGHSRC